MKIALIGHSIDPYVVSHYDLYSVENIIDNVINIMARQYGDPIFLTNVEEGLGELSVATLINNEQKFHVYVPTNVSFEKLDESSPIKSEIFKLALTESCGMVITEPGINYDKEARKNNNINMINNANFVISFWVGKKIGFTYDMMKHALSQSKFVFNALDNLKMVFNEDLEKGWTPPTVKQDIN